jgi:hypothetical protein
MNIQTIKDKIRELEGQKSPHFLSIKTLDDQVKILEEIVGIRSAPRLPKKRGPKGRNSSAMFEILAAAASPMTANDIRQLWPAHLKTQSVYPTLCDLTRKRKLDRIQVERDGRKPLYAYTIRGAPEEALMLI